MLSVPETIAAQSAPAIAPKGLFARAESLGIIGVVFGLVFLIVAQITWTAAPAIKD